MRVIAYLRVSTDKQENENQKFGFDKFCKRMDLVVTEYVEEKISGTAKTNDRILGPLLNELGKGDVLIFSEFSRIGRSIYSIFAILKDCIDKGVVIYTVKEKFCLSNDIQGKVTSTLLSLIADIERSLLVERIKETYQRKKKQALDKDIKLKWGREKGRKTSIEKSKLHTHKDIILRMVKNKATQQDIANEIGVTRKTVWKYLQELKRAI